MQLRSLFTGVALASLLPVGLASAQGLGFAARGPINPEHGYPDWYEDTNGLRLDLCLETTGFCLLEGPSQVIAPGEPFPDNFGGDFTPESFYNLAEASLPTNNGGQAIFILALEAAFDPEVIADGNQVVFARFRLRADNLIAGETYVATTPVGVFSFIAENSGVRGINFTDDAGRLAGSFDGALESTFVGPYLTWDTDLPIIDVNGREYVGDPTVEHTITGSPYGTNFFRLEGPDVGGPGVNMIETDLFAVSGLLHEPPPPVIDPTLSLSPGIAGIPNTLTLTQATPGGLSVFLFGSQRRVDGFIVDLEPCVGLALDIRDPMLLGFGFNTKDGNNELTVLVPPTLRRVVLQAVDVASCTESNLIRQRFN